MNAAQSITDMTYGDLERLVQHLIDERLKGFQSYQLAQPTREGWQSIVDNITEQQPATPSPTDLLKEDRDQWYRNS